MSLHEESVYQSKCCYRWLPDSARWLMSNGQTQRAHYYLSKCAKINNREQFMTDLKPEVNFFFFTWSVVLIIKDWCPELWQTLPFPSPSQFLTKVILVENENRKYSYLDLVRTPRIRRLALLTGIVWYITMYILVSPSKTWGLRKIYHVFIIHCRSTWGEQTDDEKWWWQFFYGPYEKCWLNTLQPVRN